MEKTIECGGIAFNLSGNGVSAASLRALPSDDNVQLFRLSLSWDEETVPEPFTVKWQTECNDVYCAWTPRAIATPVTWSGVSVNSRLAADSPVLSLVSKTGRNRCTLALSDCKSPVRTETKAVLDGFGRRFTLTLFTDKTGPFREYETDILIDRRDESFSETLKNVRRWYESCGYISEIAPEGAFEPVYSTWYSYLQKVTQKDVLEECRIAATLGMKTVIVDDGWQKDDHPSIYGFTGDWKPCLSKFPDMSALSDEIHSLGMKFVLWFSVPFVGEYAENYARFAGKYLNYVKNCDCSVLDPRYPGVRCFLIDTYVDALKKWKLDGFKLDFIDRFKTNGEIKDGMDYVSVEEATEVLLVDIMAALKAVKPDVLIEFRQPYAGIVTQKFGNMFRVWDCPNDGYMNRVQTLNMRLLNGAGAVHSDMIDISENETAESFSLQLLGTIFSVPQISFRLGALSPELRIALANYLDFWNAHRNVLMHGKLDVRNPELCFAYSSAENEEEYIALNASGRLFEAVAGKDNYCFNISDSNSMPVKLADMSEVTVKDCFGKTVSTGTFYAGLHLMDVPLCGQIIIKNTH